MENTEAVRLDGKIVKIEIVKATENAFLPPIPMSEQVERPSELPAVVYKIKPGEHAYYITISNIVLNAGTPDETVRPYEIFINTKDMRDFQWIAALSRMISAVMRKGGDISFAIEELKATFDPSGGTWVDGAYVPSTVAYIGMVIERHLEGLGLINSASAIVEKTVDTKKLPQCPRCLSFALVRQEGCDTCKQCGHSKCG
jgi:ribonucleoside-diphosphate reductase alpha chain